MADMSNALGRKIRLLRREKGFDSMESFAQALGYSWITVSRYERGKTTPDLVRLHHIADVLGVSAEDLVGDEAGVAAGWGA